MVVVVYVDVLWVTEWFLILKKLVLVIITITLLHILGINHNYLMTQLIKNYNLW